MIKLIRPPEPEELTRNKTILQQKYDSSNPKNRTPVWRENYIVKPLQNMSHGKCAYCEKFDDLEVEHYLCKHNHPDKVVEWINLLPVCHHCNTVKLAHDCSAEPIINPVDDDPKVHLIYDNFRFYPRDSSNKGKCTIEYLKLYDTGSLFKKRLAIYDDVDFYVKACLDKANHIKDEKNVEKEILERNIIKMYNLANPEKEYSAIYATEILQHANYNELIQKLKENCLWNNELRKLEKQAKEVSLARE